MKSEKKIESKVNKIFPEDDDTLLREMMSYMPCCYFPTSFGEDAIYEFAGEEFSRIRNIICREYNFDEDKYIDENAGVSPFDFVHDNFEQEVYRRIRKDYNLLRIISVRKSLTEKIGKAVKKKNNIIGTFFRNQGVHFHDDTSPEYETSPIVVVHNSNFYSYGGYESATVYELFFDKNGKLLCTLNGEGGEDFNEPLENVQVEGLLEIIHWLEEHGFIADDDSDDNIIVCDECGSKNIQQQAWIEPNTYEYIGTTECDKDDNWCEECEAHLPFCTLKEFKERMQKWWESTDLYEKERITVSHHMSFLPKGGYQSQAFVDACNKWWEDMNYDEKRRIWKENNE